MGGDSPSRGSRGNDMRLDRDIILGSSVQLVGVAVVLTGANISNYVPKIFTGQNALQLLQVGF